MPCASCWFELVAWLGAGLQREKELQYKAEVMAGADGPAAPPLPEHPLPAHWTPPPVGVLPLGTGNDLARCLNWGGGIYTVRESGMTALMYDLQRAAVVLLDRWNVAITSPAATGEKKGAPLFCASLATPSLWFECAAVRWLRSWGGC